VAIFTGLGAQALAQDLTIENARIIVGNGHVIDHGAVVIKGGRIASVSPGSPAASRQQRCGH
jgi:imidazolonepropionase-like amidohydrolase